MATVNTSSSVCSRMRSAREMRPRRAPARWIASHQQSGERGRLALRLDGRLFAGLALGEFVPGDVARLHGRFIPARALRW